VARDIGRDIDTRNGDCTNSTTSLSLRWRLSECVARLLGVACPLARLTDPTIVAGPTDEG